MTDAIWLLLVLAFGAFSAALLLLVLHSGRSWRAMAANSADERDHKTQLFACAQQAISEGQQIHVGLNKLAGAVQTLVGRAGIRRAQAARQPSANDSAVIQAVTVLGQLNTSVKQISDTLEGIAKLLEAKNRPVTLWEWKKPRFALGDIAGLRPEICAEVQEIVGRCRGDEQYHRMQVPPPHGVILCGPSGVGKTMLAHAIASEMQQEICVVHAPSMVGDQARLEQLFSAARGRKQAVIFFDEIDAVLPRRTGNRLSGMDTWLHMFLVQLIAEFEELQGTGVLVIAATNRVEMLDPAILRTGRLEKQLYIELPDADERHEILKILHARRETPYPLRPSVDDSPGLLAEIALGVTSVGGTSGFSGADLAAVLDEAAVVAARLQAPDIDASHAGTAIRRVRTQMQRHAANDVDGSHGRTTASFHFGESVNTRFAQVGGARRAKQALQQVVDIFKNYGKLKLAGCQVPRGVLLAGPPGVGKTLLARAIAGETGAAFFTVSASEFDEMYVGVGAARVRDLFRVAKRQAPSVIFIDEIDGLGSRQAGGESATLEHNRTLLQVFTELDGFDASDDVIVIAATNRPRLLDEGLVRPGRFDLKIEIDYPTRSDREEIVAVYRREGDDPSALDRLIDHPELRTGAALASVIRLARIRSVLHGGDGRIARVDVDGALSEIAHQVRPGLSFARPAGPQIAPA